MPASAPSLHGFLPRVCVCGVPSSSRDARPWTRARPQPARPHPRRVASAEAPFQIRPRSRVWLGVRSRGAPFERGCPVRPPRSPAVLSWPGGGQCGTSPCGPWTARGEPHGKAVAFPCHLCSQWDRVTASSDRPPGPTAEKVAQGWVPLQLQGVRPRPWFGSCQSPQVILCHRSRGPEVWGGWWPGVRGDAQGWPTTWRAGVLHGGPGEGLSGSPLLA